MEQSEKSGTPAIRILQVGLGPLGQKISRFILERSGMAITSAVDLNPELSGKDVGEVCGSTPIHVPVSASVREALKNTGADIAVLATVSDLERITPHIEELTAAGLPVVTTCEELAFPWLTNPTLARRIDNAARKAGVAVLATGVNPGFLMDTLPLTLTAVCRRVDLIRISRIQNAAARRVPFQKKIGAGLSLEEFAKKREDGTLRHVGLTESMQMIAAGFGWSLDRTEESLVPVVAKEKIVTDTLTIEAGYASGVEQTGRGYSDGREVITLVFRASVGEPISEDTVEIQGDPNFTSTIRGGINGDTATCAIVLNSIRSVLRSSPGLKTMMDIPLVSYFAQYTKH